MRFFFLVKKRCLQWSVLAILTSFWLSACDDRQIPLIEQKCGGCHGTAMIYEKRYSSERWRQVIHGMKSAGLKVSEDEEEQLLKVLTGL